MMSKKLITPLPKLLLMGLLLVTVIVLYPPFAHGWVGDDYVQLGYVREFGARPFTAYKIFHPTWTIWYYRPIQNLWILLGERLFGQQPQLFYAIQIEMHLIVVALIYRVARQINLHPTIALGSAALFAIHGHDVDVVTWISAIAIVLAAIFSLAAVSCFVNYVKRPSPHLLILTTLFCLLALLSHEEAILLPPYLFLILVIRRLEIRDWRRSNRQISNLQSLISQSEIATLLLLAIIILIYLIIQFTRPNATIDISSTPTNQWLSLLSPATFAEFWLTTLFHFTFWGQLLTITGLRATVITLATLGLLGMWAWAGNRIVRLGLLWTALHLAFIYTALWTQKPELYAGRHIYNAMPGVAIAIGASVAAIRRQISTVSRQPSAVSRKKKVRSTTRYSPLVTRHFVLVIFGLGVAGVLIYQITVTQNIQAVWLADVTADQSIVPAMLDIMPEVSADTHVFANRLPITPKFLRSVVYVWYGVMPPNPGGELSKLLADGAATRDTFVFDYENGRLFNLMPELQQHDQTHLLLGLPITHELNVDGEMMPVSAEVSTMIVDGPETDRRLTLRMNPHSDATIWASQSYLLSIPANSTLAFGVLPVGGMKYRVLIEQPDGTTQTLWEAVPPAADTWLDVEIGMERWWDTAVILRLEAGYQGPAPPPHADWSNPRLTTD